jgi:hypothetical protein
LKKILLIAALLLTTKAYATTVELGLTAAANLSKGVDWEKNNYQTAFASIEQKLDKFYILGYNSLRMNLDNSNPDHHVDLWKLSSGYRFSNGFVAELGHEHKHDMGLKNKKPESFDYVTLKYKFDF